jgi:hypothetical protein
LKLFLISIFILTTTYLFGQKSNTIFSFAGNEFQNWTYQDFLKSNIKKVEAYSYEIKKNGKISKDSLLIYTQELDKDSNKVFGKNCNRVFQSHGPSYLTWYSFKTYYDKNGLIIKDIESPNGNEKTKSQFGTLEWDIYQNISTYKYDSLGNLTYECNQHIDNSYTVYKHSKDTFHLCSVQAKIYEYNYNEKGQKISRYYTVDSTRYLPTDSYKVDSASVNCSYCHSKHLNDDYTYYESGKVKTWIWYTREGEIHSKKYYYYDNDNNLIKQVDSTGWYFTTIPPYWESTATHEYSDTGKTVTKIYNTEARFGGNTNRTVSKFNSKDQITSQCSVRDSSDECTNYFYTYDREKLTSIISIDNDKDKSETYFRYNLQGLLFEKKVIYQDKITQLTRYYYE